MSPRITLRDIARHADVHLSTVSLALRNSPKLKPEMRARIQKIATTLGYTPDAAMAALVAYRKGVQVTSYQSTLAWLDNWPGRGHLRGIQSFNEYFLGASERAGQFGYKLEEFSLHAPGITPARMASILRARNIQGIIVPPQEHDGNKLDFDFTGFSAVALGYSLRPASLHVVTNHQFRSITLLVNKLRSLGYRRIGLCLHSDWDNKVNNGYTSGFTSSQSALPKKDRIPAHLLDDQTPDDFRKWVVKYRLDAIITQSIPGDLAEWVRPLGLRCPRDIGIADLSVHPEPKPTFAGVHQNDRLIGATAIDFLIGMLQRNERGLPATIIYTLVDAVWHPGPSLRTDCAPQVGR
ncbi:MAG: LacI family DNA-binding transcriptional regulator [Opitutaceae bacterium]|jgi:LacI family transcriptional regulator